MTFKPVLWACAMALSTAAYAQSAKPTPEPALSLSAAAQAEVVPDEMLVALSGVHTHRDLAQANRLALQQSERVKERLAQFPAVKVEKFHLQTYSQSVNGQSAPIWHVRTHWQLSSAQPEVLSKFSGELSSTMQLNGPDWQLSASSKAQALTQLRKEASTKFLGKAREMAQNLGFSNMQVSQVQLQDEEGGFNPVMPMAAPMAFAKSAEALPVPQVPGVMTLTVTVSGQVILKP